MSARPWALLLIPVGTGWYAYRHAMASGEDPWGLEGFAQGLIVGLMLAGLVWLTLRR